MQDAFLDCFESARALIAEKKYDAAYAELKESIKFFNDSPAAVKEILLEDLLNLTGQMALLNNETNEALSYFEQELNINPGSSNACYGLGEVFFTLEKYNHAKTMLEWSIKNSPDNKHAHDALGKVNLILGKDINHNSLIL